jgi:beta-glucosidase
MGWGSGTAQFPYLIAPLDGITTRAKVNGQTVASSLSDSDLNAAKQAAASADVAIVFANADSGEGYITVEGNEGDRNDLNLWHNGDALIEAVASVNNKTVVVCTLLDLC